MATLNDFQLEFTLKQHTPLIHFHDHEGATLRATELKPKLDKFIVEQLGGWDKVDKNWLIGKGKAEHKALDYKVTITPAPSDSWKDFIEDPGFETIHKIQNKH